MKKVIKDQEFYTYKYGFTYAHIRGKYSFSVSMSLCRFKLGADWWFSKKKKLQELTFEFGPFLFSWTRIYP